MKRQVFSELAFLTDGGVRPHERFVFPSAYYNYANANGGMDMSVKKTILAMMTMAVLFLAAAPTAFVLPFREATTPPRWCGLWKTAGPNA